MRDSNEFQINQIKAHLAMKLNSQLVDLVLQDNCSFAVPALSAAAGTLGMGLVSVDFGSLLMPA